MSVKLWLIRHGRSTWNAEGRIQGQADPPLDEIGLQQTGHIADRLRGAPIAAIYSSPLQRARATAQAIGAVVNLPVVLDDRLKEYDFGVMSGLTWDGIVEHHPEFARRWPEDPWAIVAPGSEGRIAFCGRVMVVMQDIVTAHTDQQVAVVAHGGTFAAYLSALLGLDINGRHPFRFGNTSLSIIEVGDRLVHIDVLNDTCHLQDAAGR